MVESEGMRVRGWRVRKRGGDEGDVYTMFLHTQQSIFLVVIIESFADLRSQTAIGPTSQQKQKDQPHFVRHCSILQSVIDQYSIVYYSTL